MISLNQNELETLGILWDRGESKPAEIQNQFSWPIENATLRSILVNLVEKGHITRAMQGKAFYYAARVPKATLLQKTMEALARVFAGGSSRELVAQLVETADIKPADLKLIRQTAAGVAPQKTKKKEALVKLKSLRISERHSPSPQPSPRGEGEASSASFARTSKSS